MSVPKVSFFMMAYNAEAYIEKAIRSVLNQTEKDVNIFIRNNGSTDRTGDILQKLKNEDSRVDFITNKKNSVTDEGKSVFQRGWWFYDEERLGEYISIIDSDDWVKNDFVEILYNQAKKSDADITIGGTDFVDSKDNIIGGRCIPDMVLSNIGEIGNDFPNLYNNFRTWWGKLFKKDFFFENYDEAWLPKIQILTDLMFYKIDTTIMMSYLSLCNKLCCVSKPLYSCYLRENSMYSTRYPSLMRFSEAYSIYIHAMTVLKQYNLYTSENVNFIKSIHWAYIFENFNNVLNYNGLSVEYRYSFIEYIAADMVCNSYQNSMASIMFLDLRPVLIELEKRYVDDYAIYKSFMARLNRFIDMLDDESWHPCAFIVLISILCDPKNKSSFGEEFIKINPNISSKAAKKSLEFPENIKNLYKFSPLLWVDYINTNIDSSKIEKKKCEMLELMKKNKYSDAAEFAVDILEENPVDFEALICVMEYYYSSGNKSLGNLIKESMSIVWSSEIIESYININKGLIEKDRWKI